MVVALLALIFLLADALLLGVFWLRRRRGRVPLPPPPPPRVAVRRLDPDDWGYAEWIE